ncbi:actin-related protein 2/3 complex subunit 5-like isoform X1 [Lingula anatina]|uniref:Actin-related protein 2/3 complex subunit 5 n=1 Tax=Lingula anatina TaxID=7574 RepID=A0A1S3HUB2_LINAN|nr:actin-related protein 2/3 complex subunit 5-like isoform X1 [Lingula anatina]|eukprot:XP_013389608.1 actin-related protein 2/3 complex subunit 5-like isoform X1 [Lingula anatina]
MSKNTADNKFRKIDVDQYNEDNYQDEVADDGQDMGPNEQEVSSFLSQGKNLEALQAVLSNPPVETKNQAAKDRALQLVMRVLLSFKVADIDKGVNALDSQTLDVLMKYIYRGFENPSEGSSAQLLTWHEKSFKKGGLGCIVRVLTDRKMV